MKLLITGATGIIGQKLIYRLKEARIYDIKILARKKPSDAFTDEGISIAEGDLLDFDSLLKATAGADLVFHMAGITHTNKTDLYFKINAKGTENLIKACEANNVRRFIFISSRTAGLLGGGYAMSKFMAEKEVEKSKLDWDILSLSEVYGAGEKEAISKLADLVDKSLFIPIIGDGTYQLCPVYIDDIIDAMINTINNQKISRKKYLLAGPQCLSYEEIVDRILLIKNKRRIKFHIPVLIVRLAAWLFFITKQDFIVRDQLPRLLSKKTSDISSARKDLNFNPRSVDQGLRSL